MGATCCAAPSSGVPGRVLWIALPVNAAMFVVETIAGLLSAVISSLALVGAVQILRQAGQERQGCCPTD